ncbi:hypothetical protein MSAN_00585000 [Mycena sanguinolenta]|uniref:Uncharacterized protein n=1 Tax=Mycena sanguinolenta TaxID=230812 RepID=A0A8H6ZA33_9AGAR|nr:hypothetical protein MSAN_00585000 [Mycena sanguinolenta]
MDRLAVGVSPVLGRRASIVLKQIRRVCRNLSGIALPPENVYWTMFLITLVPRRITFTEVFEGIKASTSPTRLPFVLPRDIIRLLKKRKSGPWIVDDDVTVALAEHMLQAFKAGHGHPLDLWKSPPVVDSSSEDDDEWDTEVACPTLERDQRAEERRRRAERYAPWPHMRVAMQTVLTEVVAVGAVKKLLERDEIGPAPLGFHYVQVKDQVYLASEETMEMAL